MRGGYRGEGWMRWKSDGVCVRVQVFKRKGWKLGGLICTIFGLWSGDLKFYIRS